MVSSDKIGELVWYLNGNQTENVKNLKTCSVACRESFCSCGHISMIHPDLSPDIKVYTWNTMSSNIVWHGLHTT